MSKSRTLLPLLLAVTTLSRAESGTDMVDAYPVDYATGTTGGGSGSSDVAPAYVDPPLPAAPFPPMPQPMMAPSPVMPPRAQPPPVAPAPGPPPPPPFPTASSNAYITVSTPANAYVTASTVSTKCPTCNWALIGAGVGCPSPEGGGAFVNELLKRFSTISLPSYRMTPPVTTPSYAMSLQPPTPRADVQSLLPAALLRVEYPGGLIVTMNAALSPNNLFSPPNVGWGAVGSNQLHTLAMVDPDAPSGNTTGTDGDEWLHWLVVNIPGMDVAQGEVYAEYNGPTPPPGSGPHRYVLVVYQQPNGQIEDADFPRGTRAGWSVRAFAQKHGLGAPVAGIFYRAQSDSAARSHRRKRWVGIHYRSRCRCVEGTNDCTCTPRIAQGMWSGPGYYNGSQLQWAGGGYRCMSSDCSGSYYPGAYPNSRADNPSSAFNPASYNSSSTYPSFVGSRGPYFSPYSRTYFYTLPHNIAPALPPPSRTPIDLP